MWFCRAIRKILAVFGLQPEGGDRGLELGIGLAVGRHLAHILAGKGEPAQRDLPDERFGPGTMWFMRTPWKVASARRGRRFPGGARTGLRCR